MTVSLPPAHCVSASVAAAIQAKFGLNADDAVNEASFALQNRGIDPTPLQGTLGIELNFPDEAKALQDLGFTVVGSTDPPQGVVNRVFANGGWGIGTMLPGMNGDLPVGHQVFLMGYNSDTNSYAYYDGTQMSGQQIGSVPASSVKEFLIR